MCFIWETCRYPKSEKTSYLMAHVFQFKKVLLNPQLFFFASLLNPFFSVLRTRITVTNISRWLTVDNCPPIYLYLYLYPNMCLLRACEGRSLPTAPQFCLLGCNRVILMNLTVCGRLRWQLATYSVAMAIADGWVGWWVFGQKATASTALENRNRRLPCTGLVCPWIAIYATMLSGPWGEFGWWEGNCCCICINFELIAYILGP